MSKMTLVLITYTFTQNESNTFWEWWDQTCHIEENFKCGFLGVFGYAPKPDTINVNHLLFDSSTSWEKCKSTYPAIFDFENLTFFEELDLKICTVNESFIRKINKRR